MGPTASLRVAAATATTPMTDANVMGWLVTTAPTVWWLLIATSCLVGKTATRSSGLRPPDGSYRERQLFSPANLLPSPIRETAQDGELRPVVRSSCPVWVMETSSIRVVGLCST